MYWMDLTASPGEQLQSRNPKIEWERESVGQTLLQGERRGGWAAHTRVPESNTVKTRGNPQTPIRNDPMELESQLRAKPKEWDPGKRKREQNRNPKTWNGRRERRNEERRGDGDGKGEVADAESEEGASCVIFGGLEYLDEGADVDETEWTIIL